MSSGEADVTACIHCCRSMTPTWAVSLIATAGICSVFGYLQRIWKRCQAVGLVVLIKGVEHLDPHGARWNIGVAILVAACIGVHGAGGGGFKGLSAFRKCGNL